MAHNKKAKAETPKPTPASKPENPTAKRLDELREKLRECKALADSLNAEMHSMTAGTGSYKTLRSTSFSAEKQALILDGFRKIFFPEASA